MQGSGSYIFYLDNVIVKITHFLVEHILMQCRVLDNIDVSLFLTMFTHNSI